ncbi:hypothetical protein Clacol_007088 [Clathrus columnatus]|uniref:CCL2-like lectin domain-containing protein n=1 Tax=Clathrus columnatus TaxID=1419009 RepID=A0AAV5AH71_9AGAM|nr:hypothetical protein Clacol_007088 [Clathrus columnatus]
MADDSKVPYGPPVFIIFQDSKKIDSYIIPTKAILSDGQVMKLISVISTVIVAFSLGVHNAIGQTPLANGTYQFVSRVLDPSGNQLALTNNGAGFNITVSPFVHNQANQLWAVGGTSPTIEIAISGTRGTLIASTVGGVLPRPLVSLQNSGLVWESGNIDGSIVITDISNKFTWVVPTPTSGAMVTVTPALSPTSSGAPLQLWVPILTSTSNDL